MRSVTTRFVVAVVVMLMGGAVQGQESPDQKAIAAFFASYDKAFNTKDLAALGALYHPDVTVYEGGGINPGWADYRDRHLGPELKAFGNLKFSHEKVSVRLIGPDAAYVTAEYLLDAVMDGKDIRSGGLATYVLIREAGQWKIRHSHTSSRRRS
jgi:uncharacterized protein (TIGR02246 family)